MTIYFDMDGTIADLYGVDGWLEYLINGDATPYEIAKPLLRMSVLARLLNRLQREGFKIGIISWLAKNSNENYDNLVTIAKLNWLSNHLASVNFDEINIVPYGTPKENFSNGSDILFDDEIQNRENWNGKAFSENSIMEILKSL
jgi:hypothetical protein